MSTRFPVPRSMSSDHVATYVSAAHVSSVTVSHWLENSNWFRRYAAIASLPAHARSSTPGRRRTAGRPSSAPGSRSPSSHRPDVGISARHARAPAEKSPHVEPAGAPCCARATTTRRPIPKAPPRPATPPRSPRRRPRTRAPTRAAPPSSPRGRVRACQRSPIDLPSSLSADDVPLLRRRRREGRGPRARHPRRRRRRAPSAEPTARLEPLEACPPRPRGAGRGAVAARGVTACARIASCRLSSSGTLSALLMPLRKAREWQNSPNGRSRQRGSLEKRLRSNSGSSSTNESPIALAKSPIEISEDRRVTARRRRCSRLSFSATRSRAERAGPSQLAARARRRTSATYT